MTMHDWAKKWGVSSEALAELSSMMAPSHAEEPSKIPGDDEQAVQSEVRLEASEKGARLWRNNVGAIRTDTGMLRYGLANDSPAVNKDIKSSDLIGIRPVTIRPDMVGGTVGVFLAREVKRRDWQWRGSPREWAQLRFIGLVNSLGGDACFCVARGSI